MGGRWAPVVVVSTKWNGGFHRRTPARELGSDESGTWLWMPPGTVADSPAGPYDAIPGLRLLPVGRMWSAYFVPSSPPDVRPKSVYIDIGTPVRRIGSQFEFVDLDLDVEQVGDDPVRVLDRDEFEDRLDRWSYPVELVAAAERACVSVRDALQQRAAPFDGAYLDWWRLVGQES